MAKEYFLNPKIIEPNEKLGLVKANKNNILKFLSEKGLNMNKLKYKLRYLI